MRCENGFQGTARDELPALAWEIAAEPTTRERAYKKVSPTLLRLTKRGPSKTFR